MIRLGITGQAGFIGSTLYALAGTRPEAFERVPFEDAFFQDEGKLRAFVRSCDAIVHLAAVNRDPDPENLKRTNIRLVEQLISAMEAEGVAPHIVFSSSIQEARDNPYGQSKRAGRELFMRWAQAHNAKFTGCLVPNVFGPYGRPFYNSVVATFCYQLTHGETPRIDVDGVLPLIDVNELCATFLGILERGEASPERFVEPTGVRRVSELLKTFQYFKRTYFEQGVIPALPTPMHVRLFNAFRGYCDLKSFFPFALQSHADNRGVFVEIARLAGGGGQVSFSTTKPGITRGNHYHTRKVERFAVIKGKARIALRRVGTQEVVAFELDGEKPAFVDMPVWYTHNITNIGEDDLYTVFWINELYDEKDPDTFREEV